MNNFLWEILVPARSNSFDEFTIEYHQQWDAYVKSLSGGLTIFKKSTGIWLSPKNKEFKEEMIPVRISCSQEEIEKIADFTAKHYQQKAVMFYLLSKKVNIIKYDEKFKRQ